MSNSLGYAQFIKFTKKNRDSNSSQSFSNVHDVQRDILCIDLGYKVKAVFGVLGLFYFLPLAFCLHVSFNKGNLLKMC